MRPLPFRQFGILRMFQHLTSCSTPRPANSRCCVWKIEGVDQDQAESLLRSLANEFGGDPAATDSTRVLRMPGFANRKYALEEDSPDALRNVEGEDMPSRAVVPGRKTQSERD